MRFRSSPLMLCAVVVSSLGFCPRPLTAGSSPIGAQGEQGARPASSRGVSSSGAGASAVSSTVTFSSFSEASGFWPLAAPVHSRDGNVYGLTNGLAGTEAGLYRVALTGGAPVQLVDLTAAGAGRTPSALVETSDGTLYGTMYGDGVDEYGLLFKYRPGGKVEIVHRFTATDSFPPYGGLIVGADGNLYGVTTGNPALGTGTIYKMTPGGAFTTLHQLNGLDEGAFPSGLVQGIDGALYGTTTRGGGIRSCGAVFRVALDGTFKRLYAFGGPNDGCLAEQIASGQDGNLYGVTYDGGLTQQGTAFRISPSGTYKQLAVFPGNGQGSAPVSLVAGLDGNLYGMTRFSDFVVRGGAYKGQGTMFRLSTQGTLTPAIYDFKNNAVDASSQGWTLTLARDGSVLGVTRYGGEGACVVQTGNIGYTNRNEGVTE